MYSLNVPVPGTVASLATDLGTRLGTATVRRRGEHTLVAKRLGDGDAATYHELEARAREALTGAPPFEVAVTGVDVFAEAAAGESPVVYLSVESPGLEALHERLCETFDPVDGMEDDDYIPHITVARGGSVERAADLRERSFDPVEWPVSELQFWDAEHGQSVSTVALSG